MYDVAIIGGGPAGLAAGIGLARNGFRTVLFEKQKFPVNKPCGEGILPPGVSILKALDVLEKIPRLESYFFEGIHYLVGSDREVQANFREGPGLALPRLLLSQALFQTATENSGLLIEEGVLIRSAHRVANGWKLKTATSEVEARFLVGADGLRSPTRGWMGVEAALTKLKRYGAVQHFGVRPWTRKVQVYWQKGFEAYVTPCGEDEIGVAFLWDKALYEPMALGKNWVQGCFAQVPHLKERLADARETGPARFIGPFERPVSAVVTEQAALIGDAAGYLDPITGEGVSLGLKSANLLVTCLSSSGDLDAYARELKKSRRMYELSTRALLFAARHEWLMHGALSLLGRRPELFGRLLSLSYS